MGLSRLALVVGVTATAVTGRVHTVRAPIVRLMCRYRINGIMITATMDANNSNEESSNLFTGRLGYACLNTELRAQKPSVFCSRTCRLATAREKGRSLLFSLALANARDLLTMIEWNEAHSIRFMRISSELCPFASHPEMGYEVKNVPGLVEALRAVGATAKRFGHRLTMHPGQFTQLASPRIGVFTNALRDLRYQCDILNLIDMGPDSVMIIHMGGMYGDKEATLQRFKDRWSDVPLDIQQRLVLENDELCYSVDDLLEVCEQLSIPLVLDWHHASIFPSKNKPEIDWPRIKTIWDHRGIRPKQHYSESRPGANSIMERRAHSARVAKMPPSIGAVDLMIEAKDKEQAVLQLHRTTGITG